MSVSLTPPVDLVSDERPTPPELFSQDQLERHAMALARMYRLSPEPVRGRPLLPRVDDAARDLDDAYRFLSESISTDAPAVGSEDWLRDNHHIVQDQIREIRQDLPRQYYFELPKLADGPYEGYPRVYVFARELIVHTAGRFDLQTLVDFATAYQREVALTIGEIWAIPIMLRLALVEELQRLAADVVAARRARDRARKWGLLLAASGRDPEAVIAEMLGDESRATGKLSAPFVVELLHWLRDQPSSAAPAWHGLQRALEAQDDSSEEMLRIEHQREAADQLAIGNIITSMRLLSSIDWPLFFERVSLVEQILREDPAGAYERMDFLTRDRYRHSVEELAKRAKASEQSVAQHAVALAREAQRTAPQHDRTHHVGYYLISRGRFRLERDVGYPPSLRDWFARFFYGHPVLGYLGTIAVVTAAGVGSFISYGARHGGSHADLWIIAIVALLPISELAISLINLVVTSQVNPRPLPKLDLRHGIPADDRTMVVVPAIIDSEQRLMGLIDDLEVRFFANRDDHLHFALLSDFADAAVEKRPEDDALVAAATRRIDDLNTRHGAGRFFFFHRARRWNPAEEKWMGYERKRGKLAEFNHLLRGATNTSFVVQHGDLSILPSIRYVITLDSDTQLPMEAGRRLVGTLSHPLNRPRFDNARQRVTEGYGILQPRISVSVVSANRTIFSQVFSGHVGVDPYTTAVSDLYQDMFGEGSYVGKGIYDVDAFEHALAGRIPENTLLSHDLFEGFYGRAGLVTDIDLVDDYPVSYLSYAARQHRWVRGDWQIVRWLWRTVPNAEGRAVPNSLPVISRWKTLDNLRRSLIPPALVALLITGWTILPGSAAAWTTLAMLVLAFPAYIQVARSLGSHVSGVPLRDHLRAERDNILTSLRQAVFSVVVLAHQSFVMLDAIGRVLVRILITRRRLLEWVTADRAENHATSVLTVVRRMWQAPVLAAAAAAVVAMTAPDRLLLAGPILILWLISPAIVFITALPLPHRRTAPGRDDRAAFREVARKTWRFFEDLVGPADNWLIPDNYQEDRLDVIAHRTSPTNIGLQLLATLAAYDFGYLSFGGTLDRLEPTFDTLLKMQRYRGHFYNWYDTQTLAPLVPSYISTVDSGNFAGYLLTLRAGLLEIAEHGPIVGPSLLEGVEDAVNLFEAELDTLTHGRPSSGIRKELGSLRTHLARRPVTLLEWQRLLTQVEERLQAVSILLHDLEEPLIAGGGDAPPAAWTEAAAWLERAAVAVSARQLELDRLTGWLTRLQAAGIREVGADVPSLSAIVGMCDRALTDIAERPASDDTRHAIERARRYAEELIERGERIGSLADDLIEETEFGFLFNPERQLFSIGYSVTDGRLDNSYYDILASEARLASFMAIATGALSHEHWFKLGRSLTAAGSYRALLSWSASMFEYLMPLLVMRSYPGTLLDETYMAVVQRQIQYAAQRGVPWGISESAYNAQDLEKNYQYRAFGVPGLGLKRGLGEDLVVAPYASVLAAPLTPKEVLDNLRRLDKEGLNRRFGYCEAIDYTPERVPPDHKGGVVLPTWMAHHQGMSLLALDNLLNGWPMQSRFHADPRIQAADLLLQERVPQLVPIKNPPAETAEHVPFLRRAAAAPVRRYTTPHTLSPRGHLLSNGSYAVMVTNSGGGYSRRQGLAMTRWREDITTDRWGTFIFVRDLDTGDVWSTTHQPVGREADDYEVTFALDRAVYRRVDAGLETRTEIVVSQEDDAELRRVSITNHSHRARSLDVTSYAEVVLAPQGADIAHPAFSNLFIETTALPQWDGLLCARRPRSGTDRVYLVHVLSGRGRIGAATEYETDRARFIGRGRTIANPAALAGTAPLSNTTGPVLDPIVSLRQSIRLPPGGTVRLSFTTGFADNEGAARHLIEKYHDRRAVARAIALASTHAQIELRHLGLTTEDALRFQRLAGRLIFGDPRLRAPDAVQANRRPQSELWKYGISGDLPIALLSIEDGSQLPLLSDMLKAHEYLRGKGLTFDLVVLNTHVATYRQDLQDAVVQMVEAGPERPWIDRPGGVFLRRADLMPAEDQLLLRAAARAVMEGSGGGLPQQLVRPQAPFEPLPEETRTPPQRDAAQPSPPAPAPDLELFNGVGGFAEQGREYVVRHHPAAGTVTPAPWVNVVAHPGFGFAASDLGTGFTWSENSHDNRLTPWSNDPISDPPGEAIFIRDERSARFWSATPLPAGGAHPYTIRHGQGYSVYEHARNGIESKLRVYVAAGEPVKVFELSLRNASNERRELSVTLYVEWVLGENRSRTSAHVVTSKEPETGAILASNAFRDDFSDRVAFLDLSGGERRTLTADRIEFIGRNGMLAAPAAMTRDGLSDRTGATLDPCGAIQVSVALNPSETRTVIGLLGEAPDVATVTSMVRRSRAPNAMTAAFDDVRQFWDNMLGAVQVRTPDRAMDLMLNRWLLYQSLSCRIWGRSAFYQSSGAFGFRDQLQDVLALLYAAPHLARNHILHAASRQFVEGDVQHWWHEPGGQGVRTRFSDDRLWLVYAALEYVAATGDAALFDESVPFLEGRILNPDEHEAYERPRVSAQRGSIYEHCVRAIALNLSNGAHGLPLMGTGDWNDGMSLVGAEGKGESVWLGWFLFSILRPFADLAASRGDADVAAQYRTHAGALAQSLDAAWDGEWYRRAYFDDGTPLGSKSNQECRIDSLAQSWSVISGGAPPERARQAMSAADAHLVRRQDGLVLLLTPPFNKMTPSPGYIQGYLPGVRENGGQYTHAALWLIMAFAQMGDGDHAQELFSLLNPINHTRNANEIQRYRIEPYVVAADVYSQPPHTGRGGWTWYTGSASWMYRVGVASILGLRLENRALHINPCIPRSWPGFEMTYRAPRAEYRISVENRDGVSRGVLRVELDGVALDGAAIPIADDGGTHQVRVVMGEEREERAAS
ncbi:MAG TPA: glucoamylase family protein [Vicinamibacterales bacterium]|nr:glucoamylase family protein [Vicinamibacterales bacterium]